MTAEEIRTQKEEFSRDVDGKLKTDAIPGVTLCLIAFEIAAQLALLNAKLAKVTEEGGHLDWIGASIGNIADKARDPR